MKKKNIIIASLVIPALFFTALAVFRHGVPFHRDGGGEKGGEAEKPPSSRSIKKLKSLAYLNYVPDDPDPAKKGVTLHDAERSFKGVNLYVPGGHRAQLLDMEGNVLHTWEAGRSFQNGWQLAKMVRGGAVLAIDGLGLRRDKVLVKLGWDSEMEWASSENYHHDVTVSGNGDIYALTKGRREVPYGSKTIPILDNAVTIVTPGGEVKKRMSIYDLAGDRIPEERLQKLSGRIERSREREKKSLRRKIKYGFDVFHTNTVALLDRDIAAAKKGDILICIRNLDLVAIVDPDEERVVWSWGPNELDRPHHPQLLENGNFLVFDNGTHRGYSRVVELNPASGEIEWEYKADPPESFFSKGKGSAQKMPNGNVLITESNSGRVFEITSDGGVVWEFWNPTFNEMNKRRTIYRMLRLTPGMLAGMELPEGALERLRSLGYLE